MSPKYNDWLGDITVLPSAETIQHQLITKEIKMLNFSEALIEMKTGNRVARTGWNGKDMWVALGGTPVTLESEKFWNPHTKQFAVDNGGSATVEPYIVMKTAQGTIQMGWLASQADLLSEDWYVVAYNHNTTAAA